jgi:septum formation protein
MGIMLILASSSPRRKELLESLGVPFRVITSDVEENNDLSDPRELVEANASLKAGHVANLHTDNWVLGSDTTVALGNEILNKPVDLLDARSMLKRMSGRTHTVYTAVCLLHKKTSIAELFTVKSRVSFNNLDDDLITEYFELVNPLDKAGAYGIQEGKELIIEGWEGSFSNIMGLPVDELKVLLEKYSLL